MEHLKITLNDDDGDDASHCETNYTNEKDMVDCILEFSEAGKIVGKEQMDLFISSRNGNLDTKLILHLILDQGDIYYIHQYLESFLKKNTNLLNR